MDLDPSTLQAYLDRQLLPEQERELEQWLKLDEESAQQLAALEVFHDTLQEGLKLLEPPSLPTPDDAHKALARFRQTHQMTPAKDAAGSPLSQEQPVSKEEHEAHVSWLAMLFHRRWEWAWGALVACSVLLMFGSPWLVPHGEDVVTPGKMVAPGNVVAPGHKQQGSSEEPPPSRVMKTGTPQAIALLARQRKRVSKGMAASQPAKGSYHPTRLIHNGERVAPGDLLQFSLRLPRTTHCLVLSVNRKGEVFVYLPLAQERSLALPGGEHLYPPKSSMELDQSLGEERFFLFFAVTALPVKEIKRALRRQWQSQRNPKSLKAPKGAWLSETFWILKQRRAR